MKEHYVSADMIVRAQQLRKDLGFTLQSVVDESEKIGHPVSMSTVRRFFAEDAIKHKFAVDTVQGIFAVLGQTHDKTEGMTAPEQVDFLKNIIAFQSNLVMELENKIHANQEHYHDQMQKLKDEHMEQMLIAVQENQRKIDFIKSTVEDFKKQIEVKDRRMDERDKFFMAQISVKDRRFDDLSEKYDRLLEQILKNKGD